jgi:hypothetical protein
MFTLVFLPPGLLVGNDARKQRLKPSEVAGKLPVKLAGKSHGLPFVGPIASWWRVESGAQREIEAERAAWGGPQRL